MPSSAFSAEPSAQRGIANQEQEAFVLFATPFVMLRLDGAPSEAPPGASDEELRRLATHTPALDVLVAWRGDRRAHYLRLPGCAGCAAPPYQSCAPGCCAALVRTRLAGRLTPGGRLTQVRGLSADRPQRLLAAWPRAGAKPLDTLPERLGGPGRLLQRWRGASTLALLALDADVLPQAVRLLEESDWVAPTLPLPRALSLELAAAILPTRPAALAPTLLFPTYGRHEQDQMRPSNPSLPEDAAALWACDAGIEALLGEAPDESAPLSSETPPQTGEAACQAEAASVPLDRAAAVIRALPAQVATARLLGDALAAQGIVLSRAGRAALIRRLQAEGLLEILPHRGQRGAFRLVGPAEGEPAARRAE
jgi:hypothetical protein